MPDDHGKSPSAKQRKADGQHYPAWAPRFWHGMSTGVWFQMLARYRFRIHPLRLALATSVTLATPINSVLGLAQRLVYGRRIHDATIAPPIFIIGHWRSGTTYLHELMVRDQQFAYPTTYECYAPKHFLLTGRWMPLLLGFLLPRKRPMDNMSAGFGHPQEDEFALVNLGCPSTYWRMAFPNEPPQNLALLDMQDVAEPSLEHWKQGMRWFVQALSLAKQKPLILKSPPHTGRVAILSQMFPGARFVHITRDPETLFASTRRLWPSLDSAQGLQYPRNDRLDEYILECFERMYGGFESQRNCLAEDQICDVRYEDLVRQPVEELQRIYTRLKIDGFDAFRPDLEAFVSKQRDYQPNKHADLDPEIREQLRARWAGYYERYGYASEDPPESARAKDAASA